MNWKVNELALVVTALVLAAIGGLGWVLGWPALVSLHPDGAYMHWVTVLAILVGGAAGLARRRGPPGLAQALAAVLLLTGLVELGCHLAGLDLPGLAGASVPGTARAVDGARVSPNTALCMALLGLGGVLRSTDTASHGELRSTIAGLSIATCTALGAVGAVSYLTGLGDTSLWARLSTDMALHTGLSFTALGLAAIVHAAACDRHYEAWAAKAVAVAGMAVALSLWQMIDAAEARLVAAVQAGAGPDYPRTPAADAVLVVGFVAAIAVSRLYQGHLRSRRRSLKQAHLNERLEAQRAELERANHELDAFTDSVSHDLRVPLRAIDGFVQILREDHAHRLDHEGMRVLGVVQRNADKMARQIDSLLALARLGRRGVVWRNVEVPPMIQQAFDDHLEDRRRRGHETLEVRLHVDPLPKVDADPELLAHVWDNLLGNAIKFSGKAEAPRVEVRFERDDHEDRFEVIDNGDGFDPAYADRLFAPFRRLHAEDEFEGLGMGLSLVERIVRAHGGRVWGSSEGPGRGAVMGFSLPRRRRGRDEDHGQGQDQRRRPRRKAGGGGLESSDALAAGE